MAIWINSDQMFETDKGVLSVKVAVSKTGRYQYKDKTGKTIASGMNPEQFVSQFWFRNDFVK